MTDRLYYRDSRLTQFTAPVTGFDGAPNRLILQKSAFYPTSGGQPHDLGTLGGIRVTDVTDQGEDIVHVLADSPEVREGDMVDGRVDWPRRFDHMQQHTGQHLLSTVLADLFGWTTLSFHLGLESSTIELDCPSADPRRLQSAEKRANEIITENRTVVISFEGADEAGGLRKASARSGLLRIITIESLDRSACGGTHVRSTGEIGCLLIRGTERIRGNTRIEFLCGRRAVSRARADYELLSSVAGSLSSSIDDVGRLAAAQSERVADAAKAQAKLLGELTRLRGRERYAAAPVCPSGLRVRTGAVENLGEEIRLEAQAFTGEAKAVWLTWTRDSVLLAVSADSGLHAGSLLKPLLARHGGRGGGSALTAQGSVPEAGLPAVVAALRSLLEGGPTCAEVQG